MMGTSELHEVSTAAVLQSQNKLSETPTYPTG